MQTTTYTKPSDVTEPAYVELEKHTFAITYLSKGNFNGADVIISYDLSGELFLHDMRNSEVSLRVSSIACCILRYHVAI